MHFTKDPRKERRNRAKHGLDFSFAPVVFADPLHAIVFDRIEAGEERWHAIGAVGGGFKLLVVVHTYPDDDPNHVHVIGLREATAHERRRYEEEA